MSNLVITSAGLAALKNVDSSGFKLAATQFSVTNHVYTDSEALTQNLKGKILYKGIISSVEVVSDNAVQFESIIPTGVPKSGSARIGEIGIYLDDGTLFAIGKVNPAIVKDSTINFSIFSVLSAAGLGGSIDVTISDKQSLSKTNTDIMPDSRISATNTLIVSDAKVGYDSPYSSASLAIRIGAMDEEWSFVGFNRVAKLTAAVLSLRSFQLDPNLNGFWLNDGETVIVQVVSGAGAGQTRHFVYNKTLTTASNVFEAQTDFTDFDNQSVISIWRDQSVVYPDRRGIPSTQVLFAGEDSHSSTWDTSSPIAGTLKIKPIYWKSVNNQYVFDIPADTPKSYQNKNNILLFINGKLQAFNDYSIYDTQLITSPSVGSQTVSMYLFYREDSTGTNFKLFEELVEFSQLVDYNGKPSYNMPIVLDSINDSLGFKFDFALGTEFPNDWSFDGARLVFNQNPQVDTLMLVWGSEDVIGGYSQPKQYEWVYGKNNNDSSTNSHRFLLSDTPTDNSYVLFAKGEIVPKSLYTVNNNEIVISKADVAIADGDYVRLVWILNKTTNAYAVDVSAATAVIPNSLIPTIKSFSTPNSTYSVGTPINDNYCFVFLNNLKLEKDVDWKLKGASDIQLLVTLPSVFVLDVLTFSEDLNTTGMLLNNNIYSVITEQNKGYYTVPLPCQGSDYVIMFLDGMYVHKNAYSIVNNTGTQFDIQVLGGLPAAGCDLEVIVFNQEPLKGSRTDLYITNPNPYIGFRRFDITGGQVLQQNTLMFIGPVYQHKNTYTVKDTEIVLNRSIPYAILDPAKYDGMAVELLSFVSGADLTNIDTSLAGLAQTTKPARNTGPFWADPAGTNRTPNKMTVSVSSFISGASTKYIFTPPYASDNILVFVHGGLAYKDTDYVYLSLGQIAFTSKIPDGYPIDIVTFQSVDDDYGYELDTKTFDLISNSTNNYVINYDLTDEQNLFVYVSGVYFHKSWYKVVNSGGKFSIQFTKGLINGLHVEVCIWNTFKSKGSYTEMLVQTPNPTIGAKNIVLNEAVAKKNTMVFAGPIYQSKSSYNVNEMTLQLDTAIGYEYIDPINFKDLPITIHTFRTGPSKTRLITRDEVRQTYMTRYGGDLKGPLYTVGDPESDLEVANKRYVDSIKDQVTAMQDLLSALQGTGNAGSYTPVLSVAPNLIKVGDVTTIKIVNASPGKSVELEVRGSSGVYNARSIKGLVKLDGTFSIGPVGIDNNYSDYLTVTAWVDGFRVANTVDVKVTDGSTISGPAMISTDKEIYQPYDYITYAIADGTPGGKVTWSTNGATATSVPAGQQQYIGVDGTWSMQVPAGGVPTNYIVELFVDAVSCGTLSIIVSPSNTTKLPVITYSTSELYRDEVLDISVADAPVYAPVTFSAKAVGLGRSGPTDTAGLVNSDGALSFGMRFTSPGDYIIYITINKQLFTHTLKVKQVSPTDTLITEQPEGYRAYIKQY